jgi:hypothetical protein
MPKELKALTEEQGTDLMAEAMFNIRNELLRVEHETDGDMASVTLAAAVLDCVSPNGPRALSGKVRAVFHPESATKQRLRTHLATRRSLNVL